MIESGGSGGLQPLVPAALSAVGAGLLYLLLWVVVARIRIRRPRRPRPQRCLPALSLLGLLFATAPSATPKERVSSVARPRSTTPPWSEPDVFSPPHSSGRTGAETTDQLRPAGAHRPIAHHRDPADTYRVRAGDCLWSIASGWLVSRDAASIARYWPQIYKANRPTIGPDPNLIRPGVILAMPPGGIRRSDR